MHIQSKYHQWLKSAKVSHADKQLLQSFTPEQINDAFYTDIAFATAGMRGLLGPGTNRINTFTVTRATIGFAKYLLATFPDAAKRGVAISHDNRHMSRELTLQTADVLNRYGINTYIFDSLRPTPELSYAVRYSRCVGGVMITASHNPKEYNGYKVYDEDGAQLVPDKIERLVAIIDALPDYLTVEIEDAKVRGTTTLYDHKIDNAYLNDVKKIQIHPELPKKNFKIVFSPEHGAGASLGYRLLNDLGYNFTVVESQMIPDPDFGATLTPNPEEAKAYEEAIKLAKEQHAQVILITDPDADRVGMGYLASDGTYQLFSGNQSGAMLINYLFSERKKLGLLNQNSRLYTTIVTSPFGTRIAKHFGIKSELFLTGFKFIGHAVSEAERNNGPEFAFGYEESYGCLISPVVRDKDALQALVMYAEMANFYHQQGRYLDQVYDELQRKFGYHDDTIISQTFAGEAGLSQMNALMAKLRKHPLQSIGESQVVSFIDYLQGIEIAGLHTRPTTLPASDVLVYQLANGDRVIVRPSGTEPKCKFYYSLCRPTARAVKTAKDKLLVDFANSISK